MGIEDCRLKIADWVCLSIPIFNLKSEIFNRLRLPRRTKTAGNAIDREQQSREVLLTLLVGGCSPEAAQQIHLLATYLVDGGEPPGQPAPEPREPLRGLGTATHPQHRLYRSMILRLDQGKDFVSRAFVRHQVGVESGDLEIDIGESLLDFVDHQAEQSGLLEHPLQQTLASLAPDLKEGEQSASHPIPPGDEVTILRPGEDPGNGAQIPQCLKT